MRAPHTSAFRQTASRITVAAAIAAEPFSHADPAV